MRRVTVLGSRRSADVVEVSEASEMISFNCQALASVSIWPSEGAWVMNGCESSCVAVGRCLGSLGGESEQL